MRRLTLILAAACLLSIAGSAQAAPGCSPSDSACPPESGKFGQYGSGVGQLNNPRGVAADPVTGNVFVAEAGQRRVSAFDEKGQFLRAWGRGVRDGSPEAQVCTTATGCMEGTQGSGSGSFGQGLFLAVDQGGAVWVLDLALQRLQKFKPTGEFVLMAGGEVNETKVALREAQEANTEPVTVTEAEENLCTAASGDECGNATSGTGNGQFGALGIGNPIAVGPDGLIYVGDQNRIQKFDEGGSYQGSIPLPGAGVTKSLTIAPSGRIYVISDGILVEVSKGSSNAFSRVVREIAPDGKELARLQGEWQGRKAPKDPFAVAADAEGNVYVIGKVVYDDPAPKGKDPEWDEFDEVAAFDPSGSLISFESDRAGFGRPTDTSALVAVGTNVRESGSTEPGPVYVSHFDNGGVSSTGGPKSYLKVFGPSFGKPEAGLPSIASQYAVAVAAGDATVEAEINPNFADDTTFWVQYGTGKCSEGGCDSVAPVTPVQLGGTVSNSPRPTGPVQLSGLESATTYHYRFVAQNAAGGPVFGEEGTFRTYSKALSGACPNDAMRLGASALLPDCRAYELVSPLDKESGRVVSLRDTPGYPAEVKQADPAGEKLTYSSYRAFADPESAPYTSQYLARRVVGSGWENEAISPSREGVLFAELRSQYKLFSEDLSSAWLVTDSEPQLAPDALPGYRNLYQRDNEDGTYRAQCPVLPLSTSPDEYRLEPQGRSADGSHLVFRAKGALTPDAAATSAEQLYECVGATELRLVSVLPDGEAAGDASAGTGAERIGDSASHLSSVLGAVSADGSRIFWTAAPLNPGPLYVRFDGQLTVEIAPANARFRAANPDGTRVIYTVDDQLFEASIGNGSSSSDPITDQVEGVMGTSEDTDLIYFVSREDLDGGGAAQAGKANLYLYRAKGDSYAFVAELSEEDAEVVFNTEETAPRLAPVALGPHDRSARISPDGLHAVFTSNAPLTGYDNTDQASGEADAEVFRYDAADDELLCVSCNPSGARPRGANRGTPLIPFWAAAVIPGWDDQHHASRVLSDDGSRIFFEAEDALALADTNGTRDVYQWEEPGSGNCTESFPTFSPAAKGCIDLISSGKSPKPSELVDASTDGSDVFFKTAASLWSPDPGLVDIYDARVGGGFAPPPPPPAACEGDACQAMARTPALSNPSSSAFHGAGNVREGKRPKHCRKSSHKRAKSKARCAKPRQRKDRSRGR